MSARRFWAILLAADTLFILLFALSLAGLAYLRSQPIVASKVVARPSPKPIAAPKTPAPAAPAKAAPAPAAKEPAGPKPSLRLIEKPAPRRAPAPMGASPAAPAPGAMGQEPLPAAPAGKPRAKSVQFVKKAAQARSVVLHGAFLVRTKGHKAMVRGGDGIWRLSLSLLPGTYKFSYAVDGKKSSVETVTVEP